MDNHQAIQHNQCDQDHWYHICGFHLLHSDIADFVVRLHHFVSVGLDENLNENASTDLKRHTRYLVSSPVVL